MPPFEASNAPVNEFGWPMAPTAIRYVVPALRLTVAEDWRDPGASSG